MQNLHLCLDRYLPSSNEVLGNDWALNRTLLPNLIALSMLYGHLSIKIDGAAEKIFAQKVKRPEEMIPSRVAARLVVYLLRNRYLVSALKIRALKFMF